MAAGQPQDDDGASFPDTAKPVCSDSRAQWDQVEPVQEGKPVVAENSTMSGSSNQRRSQHARKQRGNSRQVASAMQPASSCGNAPSGSVVQKHSSVIHGSNGSKPRVLEVRRPGRPSGKQLGLRNATNSANTAADKPGPGSEEIKPARQPYHAPS